MFKHIKSFSENKAFLLSSKLDFFNKGLLYTSKNNGISLLRLDDFSEYCFLDWPICHLHKNKLFCFGKEGNPKNKQEIAVYDIESVKEICKRQFNCKEIVMNKHHILLSLDDYTHIHLDYNFNEFLRFNGRYENYFHFDNGLTLHVTKLEEKCTISKINLLDLKDYWTLEGNIQFLPAYVNNNDLIFVKTRNPLFFDEPVELVSLDLVSGKIKWTHKVVNYRFKVDIEKKHIVIFNGYGIDIIDLNTGNNNNIIISKDTYEHPSYILKYLKDMDIRLDHHSFSFLENGNIVFVEMTNDKKCGIGVIDKEACELISFQKFDLIEIKGRARYGYPVIFNDRLYCNDTDENLHIFEYTGL